MIDLQSIGSRLREARVSRGMSLEEISGRTRISLRQLRALEDARLEDLPETFYIKSFIRQFAREVGVNVAEIMPSDETPVRPHAYQDALRGKDLNMTVGHDAPPLSRFFLRLLAVLLVLACLLLLIFWALRSFLTGSLTISEPAATPPPPAPSAVASPAVAVPRPLPIRPIAVTTTLRDDSWIQAIGDGENLYIGVMKKGTEHVWTAKEKLELRIGRTESVDIKNRDQLVKNAGRGISSWLFTPRWTKRLDQVKP